MPSPSVMANYRSAWIAQVAIVIASLACGTAFWLVVQLTTYEETTLLVPIVPSGVPEEVLVDPSWEPKQSLVKFTVPRAIRDEIQPERFQIRVDFSNVRASFGTQLEIPGSTPLSISDVHTELDGVTPVEILSRQISWTARLRHARARVVPDFRGDPAEGFERRGFNIVQSEDRTGSEMTVLMTAGAERQFQESGQELLVVRTEPVDLTGRSTPFIEKKSLIFPYEGMSPFPEKETSVVLEVDIVERTTSRLLKDVPVGYSTLRKGLYVIVDPPTVQVSLTGRTSVLKDLDPRQVVVNVWGVPEAPGETRELPVEPHVVDPALRGNILGLETIPRMVKVRVLAVDESQSAPRPVTETADDETSPTPNPDSPSLEK